MGKLKWKRLEPGNYQSGDWHVKGTGTNWDLYKGRKHIATGTSKKECQLRAEDPLHSTEEEPQVEAPKKSKVSLDDLHGVVASLYLEITHLSAATSKLAHYVKEEAEQKEKLTKAVLILGKHVGQLK